VLLGESEFTTPAGMQGLNPQTGVIVSFDQVDTVGAAHASLLAGWVVVDMARFPSRCLG